MISNQKKPAISFKELFIFYIYMSRIGFELSPETVECPIQKNQG
jgi:hypothetical protein